MRKVIDEDGTDEIACMNFKYRKIRKKKMFENIYRNPAPIGRKPGRQQIATGHARWRVRLLTGWGETGFFGAGSIMDCV